MNTYRWALARLTLSGGAESSQGIRLRWNYNVGDFLSEQRLSVYVPEKNQGNLGEYIGMAIMPCINI